ncbi:MAG: zinc-dependent metalloprotease, partial [Actinomycetota bacterium]
AQLGAVLGLLSHRVVGQYDALEAHADEVWFVGANVVMMERRFDFAPRDFRLWVAIHELTHRAQFLGSPWLREHFLASVEKLVGSLELEAYSLLERVAGVFRRREEGIPAGVRLLGPDQREQFNRLQAFMSVLEGHANFVMDRVGEGRIASLSRMRRMLRSGATSEGPLAKLLKKVLGLDLKRRQYEEGQRFFEAVFAARGAEGVRICFSSAEALPDLEEMRSPERWLARAAPAHL